MNTPHGGRATPPAAATGTAPLERLEVGERLLVGGDRFVRVPHDLADAFRPGDRLVVVHETGALLHLPACSV